MLHITKLHHVFGLITNPILALLALIIVGSVAASWDVPALAQAQKARAVARVQTEDATEKTDEPLLREYKGVTIDMSADEARQKLGEPLSKNDDQDFYAFSESETAQLFYDGSKKVSAISVSYVGSGAPACKAIFGEDTEHKPDGSTYKTKQYAKAGYWVSYSRTAGDSPVTTITIKKM